MSLYDANELQSKLAANGTMTSRIHDGRKGYVLVALNRFDSHGMPLRWTKRRYRKTEESQ